MSQKRLPYPTLRSSDLRRLHRRRHHRHRRCPARFLSTGKGPPDRKRRLGERKKRKSPKDQVSKCRRERPARADRKSTRLNSSHTVISYAVFCLKKKK